MAQQPLKPFHETLVELAAGTIDIGLVRAIIQKTKIPKGHDAIIAAINEFWKGWPDDIRAAIESLEEQKRAAASEELEKKSLGSVDVELLVILNKKLIELYKKLPTDDVEFGRLAKITPIVDQISAIIG